MATTIHQLLGETAGAGLKQRGQFPTEEAETETGSSPCLSDVDLESDKDLEQNSTSLSFPPGLEVHAAAQCCSVAMQGSRAPRKGGQGFAGSEAARTLLEGLRARGSGVLAQLPQQDRRANKKGLMQKRQQQSGPAQQQQQKQQTKTAAARPWQQQQQPLDDWQVAFPELPAPSLDWILPAPMKVLLVPTNGGAQSLNLLDPTVPVKKKPLLFDSPAFLPEQLSPATVPVSQLAMLWESEVQTMHW